MPTPTRFAFAALAAACLAAAGPAAAQTLLFQQGLDGYTGAADTQLRGSEPDVNYSAETEIGVDASDGGAETQALLRFDGVFGTGPGQVAPGQQITQATLTLNITSEGSGLRLFEVLQPLDFASLTWNSAINGLQADGVELASTPLFTVGANDGGGNIPEGPLVLDLTAALQRVQSGAAPGLGWALLPFTPDGTNGVDFFSAEWFTVAERPLLSVSVVPEPQTWALMLGGLLAVGFLAQRRRQG